MKKLLFILSLIIATNGIAQKSKIENDTLYYQTLKAYKGSELNLWYGSDQRKNFVFVFIGSLMTGLTPLESGWAKQRVKIDKIYKGNGKCYARGVMLDAPGVRALGGNKIFIDIEGAVDFKELKTNE